MKNQIKSAFIFAAVIAAGLAVAQQRVPVQPIQQGELTKVSAAPLPNPVPLLDKSFAWQGGAAVKLCDKKGNLCVQRVMPHAVGTPVSVTQGSLIDSRLATASWLVTSSKRYSLCLSNTALASNVVTCHPIQAPLIPGAEIQMDKSFPYPLYNFIFVGDKGAIPSADVLAKRKSLVARFTKAVQATQIAATRVAMKRYSGKLLKRPNFVDVDEGGTCSWTVDGDIYCDGSSGSGGGSGGGDGYYPDTPDPVDDGGSGAGNGDSSGGSGESGASAGDGCIITPIGMICTTTGQRPPPADPEMDPLPQNNPPWFPQSWCDFWNVLCSAGQEPRDNDRGTGADSGKTYDELMADCMFTYETEMDVCKAQRAMGADWRTVNACESRAAERLSKCQINAGRKTGNGAHPAP